MLFFLDIDGVMVDDTLILTSSHKSNHSLVEWLRIFKNRGIEIKTIRVLPENNNNISRKDELVNWFNSNEINQNW